MRAKMDPKKISSVPQDAGRAAPRAVPLHGLHQLQGLRLAVPPRRVPRPQVLLCVRERAGTPVAVGAEQAARALHHLVIDVAVGVD